MSRRPVSVAYKAIDDTARTIVLLGTGLALLSIALAWMIARNAAAPVRAMTQAARQLGRDPSMTMLPRFGGSQEFFELSASLRSLLRRIGVAEQESHRVETQSTLIERRFHAEIATLQRVADTDPLTGLLNRRSFLMHADDAMLHHDRHQRSLSILVADIDVFKRVNDSYGHPAGDEVIRQVGFLLEAGVRSSDKVARFGGEEFVILLRDADEDQARHLAERMRLAVRAAVIHHAGLEIRVTISIGGAVISTNDTDIQALIERADRALYDAKSQGRDCVSMDSRDTASPIQNVA
ncbi:GGDEF domain-containing protein [Lichenihabitans psoromatis]|uniref:GGDEF domain-containing protein n=1 Tax=Lichenihabitans psoromatis TaxID=2528642 RepID=UPI001038501A|nr:GGDEF domain-containing protein [Lichenihabitans psoromatis]